MLYLILLFDFYANLKMKLVPMNNAIDNLLRSIFLAEKLLPALRGSLIGSGLQ